MIDDGNFGAAERLLIAAQRLALHALLANRRVVDVLARPRSAAVDGHVLAKDVAAVLALNDVPGRRTLEEMPIGKARARLQMDVAVVAMHPPTEVEHEDRVVPTSAALVPIRLYTPPGLPGPSPALIYFHGGGWATGSVTTHDPFCRELADRVRCRVVSVEYRRGPEHPFPAAVEDTLAATRWVMANAEALSLDPTRIAVGGDSAGGNLAAVVARKTQGDARAPFLQVLLYPALDATRALPSQRTFGKGYFLTRSTTDWFYGNYVGNADLGHPDLSPLLAPDVARVPAFIATSGFDVLRDEGRAYAERLKHAGVRVDYREFTNQPHGFVLMTGVIDSARVATDCIYAELTRLLYG